MSVANLRTGIGAQLAIATNALHDPTTIVTPNYALEFESESIADTVPVLRKQGLAGTLVARSGRVRPVDTGQAGGDTVHSLLNTGYARLLWHCFGGYTFSWPGSTNGSATLTFNSAASNNDTVTIEGQVYTFKTALTASPTANEILVASTAIIQGSYFAAAVNRGVTSDGKGSGTAYGSPTPRNADVVAVDNGDGTVTVSDRQGRGTAVNAGQSAEVATTETLTDVSSVWDNATLTGGVDGTDTRRLHTITIDALRLRELMATVQIVRPPSNADRVPFTHVGKPVSVNLACSDEDALMITSTWDMLSRSLATAAISPSYPATATFFDYTQIGVTIDATTAPVQGIDLTFDSQQASRSQFGSASRRQHLIGDRPTITGTLTREFENSDIYAAWIAGTEAALVITATGGTIPSSASAYQCIITVPDIQYTGATPNVGGPGVVGNDIPFEVLDDGSNPPIQIQYYTDEGFVGSDG